MLNIIFYSIKTLIFKGNMEHLLFFDDVLKMFPHLFFPFQCYSLHWIFLLIVNFLPLYISLLSTLFQHLYVFSSSVCKLHFVVHFSAVPNKYHQQALGHCTAEYRCLTKHGTRAGNCFLHQMFINLVNL